MKSLRKLFVFAPVMLLSLTACEAKIDEARAKERIYAYKPSDVATNYKSVDIKMEIKVKKNTGAFAEDGSLYSVVSLLSLFDFEQKGEPVESGIFTTSTVDEMMASLNSAVKDGDAANVTYYSYKTSGLKIVADAKQTSNAFGPTIDSSSKMEIYVGDDGRIEKASGSSKLNCKGASKEDKVDGVLDYSLVGTFTWNK